MKDDAPQAGGELPRWIFNGVLLLATALLVLLAVRVVVLWQQQATAMFWWITFVTALLALGTVAAMLLLLRRLQAANRRLRSEGAERAVVQQQMRESRRRLQLLLDHMPDGVLAYDAGGRVEWINPAARLMFQRSVDDTVGQPVARLVPDLDAIRPTEAGELAEAEPGMVAAYVPRLSTRGLRRDGSEFPLEIALVALPASGGAGMCVCRDITDAQSRERMKSEFVSMVSHELRTPLTSLRGSLAMLADGMVEGIPADAQRLLRMASVNSERLVVLVNDILDFEKLSAGAMRIDFDDLDLCSVASRAVESLEGMAHQNHVTQKLLTREATLPVRGDAARLTQVIVNLLSNAIKYSPPYGTVHLILSRQGERARLTVRDQGPGVPADFVARLFRPFEQAADPRHRKQGGTGLGLAISRGLMETMYGAIGIDPPQPGDGASFWIELPLNTARPSTFGDLD